MDGTWTVPKLHLVEQELEEDSDGDGGGSDVISFTQMLSWHAIVGLDTVDSEADCFTSPCNTYLEKKIYTYLRRSQLGVSFDGA